MIGSLKQQKSNTKANHNTLVGETFPEGGGRHLDKSSIVKIEYNMDKNESHSTIKKAKFVHFVLFVKKGPCYIGNFGQNFGNHILFLKKVDRIP